MTHAVAIKNPESNAAAIMERVLATGDLSKLTPEERTAYLLKTCETLGLNPLTRPFDYFVLQGRTVLYAKKDCTDQLRTLHSISIPRMEREIIDGVYVVTAYAVAPNKREDSDIGAVPIQGLAGLERANAMKNASPCVSTSVPPWRLTDSRMRSRWSASARS